MTQKASLLAVATVFTWLMVNNVSIYSQRREQGLIREIKLPVQELELKCSRGLCMRRGCICGILQYMYVVIHALSA